jgi:hypothetical protein
MARGSPYLVSAAISSADKPRVDNFASAEALASASAAAFAFACAPSHFVVAAAFLGASVSAFAFASASRLSLLICNIRFSL